MNLNKSYEFFQPEKDTARIHIIGCGSVGSTVAENLARCGVKKMTLWDFDTVESHNIVNQMFTEEHIGMSKVDALTDILKNINPEIETNLAVKPEGWKGETLTGYVFLATDNIEIRKEIVQKHMNNLNIKAMFDIRTTLTGAQHYAAEWKDHKAKKQFFDSMNFSHEEAAEETEVSACGITLGVVTTVRIISGYAVNNYIKFTKKEGYWKTIFFDGFAGILDAFE